MAGAAVVAVVVKAADEAAKPFEQFAQISYLSVPLILRNDRMIDALGEGLRVFVCPVDGCLLVGALPGA